MLSCLTENISLPITQGSKVIIPKGENMKVSLESLKPGQVVEIETIEGFKDIIPIEYQNNGHRAVKIPTSPIKETSADAIQALTGLVCIINDIAIVKPNKIIL